MGSRSRRIIAVSDVKVQQLAMRTLDRKNSSTFIHQESWLADLLIRVSVDCGKPDQQTEKLIRPNLSHLLLLLFSEDDLFTSIALSLQQ